MTIRKLSTKGANMIANFEGYRSTPYNDAAGHATIGVGHLLHYGPVNSRDAGLVWSRAKSLRVLRQDAEKAAAAVRKIRPPILKQSRFDALVSLVFNLGPGILERDSTLGRALRSFSRKGVAEAILLYDHAGGKRLPGLTCRRQAEARLWKTGKYE